MNSDEWREFPLPEVIDFQEGPGIMARDFREDGVPLIRLAGLTANSLLEGCNYLDGAMVRRKWNHFRLQEGDTLMSSSASLGRVARVRGEAVGSIAYTGLIRMRPKDDRLSSDYIQYLLAAPSFQRQIEAMGAGSVMRHFGPSHLKQMTVTIPPRAEQERIASSLGALADKLASNRRAQLLLQDTFMARWSHEIRAPVVGDRAHLADLVDNVRDRPVNPDLPYIGLDQMPRGCTILEQWLTDDAPSASVAFATGDILFGKLRPYFRKVGVAPLDGRCSTEILVLRSKRRDLFGFVLGQVFSQRFIDHCDQVSTGTRMPRAEWKNAGAFEVTVPDGEALARLNALADTAYKHVGAMTHEMRTLAAIRDALLPKLVSGKIRVPLDAHDLIEQSGQLVELSA